MLSTTSEYALRALTVMAALPEGASILGRDLARHTGVPSRYLAKILTTLHNAGIVGTARGSNGGYWLARPADSIRIQDIVVLFDIVAMKRGCLLWPGRTCSEEQPCSAHSSWKGVREAYMRFLENVTLANISERPRGCMQQRNALGGLPA
jgi:Rrf2 family transcriptional regulator, iron-sulfur cluster assembly transcription factor